MVSRFRGRLLVPLAVTLTTVLIAVPVSASSTEAGHHVRTGVVRLHPANDPDARATITFRDDGETLTMSGYATGLDPTKPYASLIYDNKSNARHRDTWCEPAIFDPGDPDYILTTMFMGFWVVHSDGTATLYETNIVDDETGERVYVPLDKFRTVSIRDLTVPGPFGPGSGPDAVMACGVEHTHRRY